MREFFVHDRDVELELELQMDKPPNRRILNKKLFKQSRRSPPFNPAKHFTEPRPVIANAGKMDTTDPIHEYPADKERWLNSLWREGRDRLRRGYGVVSKRMDYLGARELTIFSKRGSPRSGSHHGINLSWP
jgi:hypothetical protein